MGYVMLSALRIALLVPIFARMRGLKSVAVLAFIIPLLLLYGNTASAVPVLQLFIEDDEAYYDYETETWVIESFDFTLQVLGTKGVQDVYLAAAMPPGQEVGSVIVSPAPPVDPEHPEGEPDEVSPPPGLQPPTLQYGTPTMGNNQPLPPHGIYPTKFYEYALGNFSTDEQVYDMIPGGSGWDWGEIKRYQIQWSGDSDWLHFDAYNHIEINASHIKSKFAPFSHDAGAVPEPATLIFFAGSIVSLAGYLYRKPRRRR